MGQHNKRNALAAYMATKSVGVPDDIIRTCLNEFPGVEHRLERVCEKDGVLWINDSKATNVNSCWYALESMTTPTVLILGGKDKRNDFTHIDDLVRSKVKAIVCMGKDNAKLLEHFGGMVPEIVDTHSVEDAVKACAALAREGDTVLLSPCCASFDLFKSYEDRGEKFKAEVNKL